jgi:aminopeptidase N
MSRAQLTRCLLVVAVVGLLGAPAVAAQTGPNDPFFPRSGDPGYDVSHYDARLSFQPASGRLKATATIEASPLKPLRQFSLDLDGLRVTGVSVDGE